MNAYQKGFFYTFSTFILLVFSGWVVTCLWDWFVVPFGMKSITVPHAMGLTILAQLIINTDIDQDKTYGYYLVKSAALAVASLIVGYLLSDYI